MNKYLFIVFSLLAISIVACQKDEPDVIPVWKQKNLYRVKEIAGTNEAWGNFRLECGYVNEKLDSIICYDEKGKRLGRLRTDYSGSSVDFYWYDYVVSVDADSVAKLDPDSIPYAVQVAVHWNYQLVDNKIQQEKITKYGRKELSAGADFDYTYELKEEKKYLYEYDDIGRLLYLRELNLIDIGEIPSKYEFLYDQDRPAGYLENKYGTDSWLPYRKFVYEWEGAHIQQMCEYMSGDTWSLVEKQEFAYQNGYPVRLTTSKGEVNYVYDPKGCLSGILMEKINIKIIYEIGHGNFSWLRMPESLFSAEPSIK